jgi:soluble lytic murein transglycosylase-like protein
MNQMQEPMPRQTMGDQIAESNAESLADLSRYVEYVESSGNPKAVSPIGAAGLMGVMPGTASQPGFGIDPMRPADLFDPAKNRAFGEQYLAAMLKRYKGNPEYAIAAYNWGPGNTDRWIRQGANLAKLPTDTRDYIRGWRGQGKHKMPQSWKRYGE